MAQGTNSLTLQPMRYRIMLLLSVTGKLEKLIKSSLKSFKIHKNCCVFKRVSKITLYLRQKKVGPQKVVFFCTPY